MFCRRNPTSALEFQIENPVNDTFGGPGSQRAKLLRIADLSLQALSLTAANLARSREPSFKHSPITGGKIENSEKAEAIGINVWQGRRIRRTRDDNIDAAAKSGLCGQVARVHLEDVSGLELEWRRRTLALKL